MNPRRKETKTKLKNIISIEAFTKFLDSSTLSTEEKKILRYIYVEKYTLLYVADLLGYSEDTIKKKHIKIIDRLYKLPIS